MSVKEDRIRQRAYEIWEREGRPDGEDMRHWLQAFQEIAASADADSQPAGKSRAKKTTSADKPVKPKVASRSKGGAQSVPTTIPPPKAGKPVAGLTKH
ncbi:DUF2934 domain-containing protein [Rhizobium sp. 1399]|uniref:DUF2934 domain-containing protein n=1 Tax=Rhizobium sp. 1399 TaxID=2817758 RepID=UPI002860028A|nr:DUF2934 domain-containing protein [Rhizobium sp. 1399]MDR6670230.1 hypothetical protein [Rhizobium sp. 1399]